MSCSELLNVLTEPFALTRTVVLFGVANGVCCTRRRTNSLGSSENGVMNSDRCLVKIVICCKYKQLFCYFQTFHGNLLISEYWLLRFLIYVILNPILSVEKFEFPKTHKKAAQLEKTKNPIGKLFFSSWEVCE